MAWLGAGPAEGVANMTQRRCFEKNLVAVALEEKNVVAVPDDRSYLFDLFLLDVN